MSCISLLLSNNLEYNRFVSKILGITTKISFTGHESQTTFIFSTNLNITSTQTSIGFVQVQSLTEASKHARGPVPRSRSWLGAMCVHATIVTGDTKRTYDGDCHSSRIGDGLSSVMISAGRLFFRVRGSGGSHSGRLFFLRSWKRLVCWCEQCWRGGTAGSSRRGWLRPATVCDTNDIFTLDCKI